MRVRGRHWEILLQAKFLTEIVDDGGVTMLHCLGAHHSGDIASDDFNRELMAHESRAPSWQDHLTVTVARDRAARDVF